MHDKKLMKFIEVSRITNIIHQQYQKRTKQFLLLTLMITIITTLISYFITPNLSELNQNLDRVSNDAAGLSKVFVYVVNNGLHVPLQMFFLSLIPIPFLYLCNLILTAIIPGILFGIMLHLSFAESLPIFVASLPHSITEMLAYCILAALLYDINKVIRLKVKKCFKKTTETSYFFKIFLQLVKGFLIIVLPLIILAAFLETYFADYIYSLFK
ncbi:stage II sporulation protein M [Brochothrix thermosphacta]|uniref:stage II sporulation protein M n=4 Tax=Brochothrix thermosphacta TaxID=2756 RepID=UPI0039B00714